MTTPFLRLWAMLPTPRGSTSSSRRGRRLSSMSLHRSARTSSGGSQQLFSLHIPKSSCCFLQEHRPALQRVATHSAPSDDVIGNVSRIVNKRSAMETALSSCSCGVVESASAGDLRHSSFPPLPPLLSPPSPPLPSLASSFDTNFSFLPHLSSWQTNAESTLWQTKIEYVD
jgi:hypothetical protein